MKDNSTNKTTIKLLLLTFAILSLNCPASLLFGRDAAVFPEINCLDNENYPECLKKLEEKQLKRFKEYAHREGNVLNLKLQNKQIKSLKSTLVEPEKGSDIYFLGYLNKQKYYLLIKLFYEEDSLSLVSASDGKEYYIPGQFIESPDSRRIVSSSVDIVSGGQFRDNAIKIFRFSQTELIEEWGLEPLDQGWGPIGTRWLNNSTVQFRQQFNNSCAVEPMIVQLVNGRWELVKEEE